MDQKWLSMWNEVPLSNKLRSITQTAGPSYWSLLPRRGEQVMYSRLRIGHTLATHGYLLKKLPAPECDTCRVRLTVKHILVECTRLALTRSNIGLPLDLSETFDISNISRVISFINSTGFKGQI